jgi:hypothetical protein
MLVRDIDTGGVECLVQPNVSQLKRVQVDWGICGGDGG